MKAYLICNNDSVEHVVIGTEAEANLALADVKADHLALHLKHHGDSAHSRENYKRNYWHLHDAPVSFRPGKVTLEQVSTIRMVAGNEGKFTHVIDMGRVKHWVGIGWVTEREATAFDFAIYPEVDRS